MSNQSQIQSVLDEARWASAILPGKHSDINVHLVTFPGVVGGVFHAKIAGLIPDHFGQIDVSITCTGIDSDSSGDESDSPSPITIYQEVESKSIQNLSFEVVFRIPFEAEATEEGAIWHLLIHLGNGTTEIFEVPVCRTPESNPKITSVQIAAQKPAQNERQQNEPEQSSNKNQIKPYAMTSSNGELILRFPARTPGRAQVLPKGLGVFAGLWGTMLAFVCWVSDEVLEPILILGLPLIFISLLLVFMLFGVSHCKINKEKLVTTHKLFGLPLNWRNANRCDLEGFSTICLGAIKSQLNYMVIAKTNKFENVFLCLTVFNQDEARNLARHLNQYWEVGKL